MAFYATAVSGGNRLRAWMHGNTITDEELVSRCLCGEEDAFGLLYERYRFRVFGTAVRILRDREEARDAVQEVFTKVFRMLSTWDPGRAKFSTWLYRLAANHVIDIWRLQHRKSEIPLEAGELSSAWNASSHNGSFRNAFFPEREVEKRERLDAIRRCVDALPPFQKRIFLLRHFQGLRLQEIAESEGRKLATVKTSLHRASQTLRRRLQPPRAFDQAWITAAGDAGSPG